MTTIHSSITERARFALLSVTATLLSLCLGACSAAPADDSESSAQALCHAGMNCHGDPPIDDTPAATFTAELVSGTGAVNLSWSGVPADRPLTIRRMLTLDWTCSPAQLALKGHWTVLNSAVAAGVHQLTDSTALPDARYFYELSWAGGSAPLLDSTDTAITVARGQKFKIDSSDRYQINYSWPDEYLTDNQFSVERQEGSSWRQIQQVAGDWDVTCRLFTGSDTNLTAGTRYCYRLKVSSLLSSGYSAPVCQYTKAPQFPHAPTNFHVTAVTATSISVAWTDDFGDEDSFVLGSSSPWADESVSGSARTYTYEGLAHDTSYQMHVKARNRDGDSANVFTSATTGHQAPPSNPCGSGPPPQSFTFCRTCPSEIIPKSTISTVACTRAQALAILQNQAINCSFVDNACH